jgi:hypothetical protein
LNVYFGVDDTHEDSSEREGLRIEGKPLRGRSDHDDRHEKILVRGVTMLALKDSLLPVVEISDFTLETKYKHYSI